jgi:hypothetical protein
MVAITERGGQLLDTVQRQRREVFNDVLSRLDDGDRAEVIAALGKIATVLDVPEKREPVASAPPMQPDPSVERKQTANYESKTSKDVGREPVIRPAKRMKIEWD